MTVTETKHDQSFVQEISIDEKGLYLISSANIACGASKTACYSCPECNDYLMSKELLAIHHKYSHDKTTIASSFNITYLLLSASAIPASFVT